MATADVTRVLDEAAVHYELLPHAHTGTATAPAEALGLRPAKTLAVRTPDGYLRAVLPASERLDLRKLPPLTNMIAKGCRVSGSTMPLNRRLLNSLNCVRGGDAQRTVRGRLLEPLPTFGPSGYRLLAIDASLGEANQFAEVHGYHHLRTLAHKPS